MAPLLVSVAAGLLYAQEPSRKADAKPATQESHARGAARCKASQLIGCAITNTKNESLGSLEDVVLDSENHCIAYGVVAFGGFLGMGEKYFALPWRLIEIGQRGEGDALRATLGLDQATLKAAPGFDKGHWPDMANPAWAKQVDDYYAARDENPRPDGAAEPKGSGLDGKSGKDSVPSSKSFAHRRLSRMIGTEVVDAQHKALAEIEDLVVDAKLASIDAALLGFGGTLGIGERLALVPFENLTLDQAKGVFVLSCTTAQLEAMALPKGKWPALRSEEWLTSSREACAKALKVNASGNGDVIVVDASGVVSVPYADAFDPKRLETVKGTITTIGAVRIGNLREERLRLRVRATDGCELIVYAAPESFGAQQGLGLRPGKVIEITGSPTKYGTQTVLVAGSLSADGKTAKLRDDQGRAAWLTP